MQTSEHTVYATVAQSGAKLLALARDEPVASEPEVVANAIAKAIKAKEPYKNKLLNFSVSIAIS